MDLPEDADEKVRRNLVTFSAGVLLFAWLRVPIAALAEKAVGATGWSADPLRAWFAAAAILVYLAVRFHFSGGGKEAFQKLGERYQMEVHWSLDALVKREVATGSFSSAWDPPVAEALAAITAPPAGEAVAVDQEPPRFELKPANTTGAWKPRVKAVLRVWWTDMLYGSPSRASEKETELTFSLPLPRRIVHFARAWWVSWVYSEDAVQSMVPAWLCAGATYMISYRLGALCIA